MLDIVTSSGHVHRALASLDEDAVLAPLSEAPVRRAKSQTPTADMVDELCQVVMLTSFDLSKLTAKDIAALQNEGQDLRRFKTELLKIASSIRTFQTRPSGKSVSRTLRKRFVPSGRNIENRCPALRPMLCFRPLRGSRRS